MRLITRLVRRRQFQAAANVSLQSRSNHSFKQRTVREKRVHLLAHIFCICILVALTGCGSSSGPPEVTAPSISGLSVTSGVVGAPVTINGANFGAAQGSSTVTFNGVTATVTSWSATSIVVTVPAGAASGNVVVTVGGVASNGIMFTVSAAGGVSVTISPKRAATNVGQGQSFSAVVTGNANTSVTWEVDSVTGGSAATGTIDGNGNYTPPTTGGTHTVGARSVANPAVVATASIAVTDLTAVATYHNNPSRDGTNTHEFALTPATVNTATFGKRFSCALDAPAYAQPLWVGNVMIQGAAHNIIIAATMHNTVYAFDADASPCKTYWSTSALVPGETWVLSTDLLCGNYATVGIVGTPAIDVAGNTVYVVAESKTTSGTITIHSRLHALSLINGTEKFGGPVDITVTSAGSAFVPSIQNQRPGLALVNGQVYISYAGLYGDCGTYYGWVLGYNASNLTQTSAFNDGGTAGTGPNGGIWMSGGAPAFDTSNNLYVATGNGPFDGSLNFGDSIIKLSPTGGLAVSSFFAPYNQGTLDAQDIDLGSGGVMLIDPASGPVAHLLIQGGKQGFLYLLNRDGLGGFNASNNNAAVQVFPAAANMIMSTPVFWNNTLYIAPARTPLQAYAFNAATGQFTTVAGTQSATSFGSRGATASLSAQGTTNGIVWLIDPTVSSAATLRAYNASNLTTELWDSSMVASDQAGVFVEFTVPTVANGKVYIGTATEIDVYGLLPN
ncbi:MAG: IPT/TIG domain-containing protein [Candidatus Acidiferrales bacterium]